MFKVRHRSFSAYLLLGVVLFMSLPRTLLHHHDEGLPSIVLHGDAPVVHTDTHCAICEVLAPVCEDVTSFTLVINEQLLGVALVRVSLCASEAKVEFPRLRGPPELV
jgi:hypothetical protein